MDAISLVYGIGAFLILAAIVSGRYGSTFNRE